MNIEKFKNIHKGQRCFILGNGPSLNKIDLSLLKDEITFGCNHIYLMKDFKPSYYCIADYWVMEKIKKEVLKTYPEVIKFSTRTHQNKVMHVLPNTCNIEAIPQVYDKNGKPQFSDDLAKGIYGGYSITYCMLQIANYLGFNEIYLLGIDGIKKGKMDSFFPDSIQSPHFQKQTELSHIAFKVAREFLESKGTKIFNASPETNVDCFKNIDFNDLWEKEENVGLSHI